MRNLTLIAAALAWLVLMLGATTRLTDAGLGCPDWPLCYGQVLLKSDKTLLVKAQSHYPEVPIEVGKAMMEMVHRYAAGTLAVLIFVIGVWSRVPVRKLKAPLPHGRGSDTTLMNLGNRAATVRERCFSRGSRRILPISLMALVIFQAALGMWTVTLKLLPVIVMAHLLGGMLIFSLLCLLGVKMSAIVRHHLPRWRFWFGLVLALVFCQIALGGWVSANYAGIACLGFPKCNGLWMPELHFAKGFHLLSPVGVNYQGGTLDAEVRVSIQFVHRLFAFLVLVATLAVSGLCLMKRREKSLRVFAGLSLLLVLLQVSLGIINVTFVLPLPVAVMHNGVAALLLACQMILFYLCRQGK